MARAQIQIDVPIAKADAEKRIVTGVVLEPNIVDAHDEWERPETIEKAAHDFLASHNAETRLGLQHKVFGADLELVESYIAPHDLTIGGDPVKAGSWVMSVRVIDEDIWQAVKSGAITGFSIGGVATTITADPS